MFGGLFSKAQTDETGQVSTIKEVGKFKGIIKIINEDEKAQYQAAKNGRIGLIKKLVEDIAMKKIQNSIGAYFQKIDTAEGKEKFMGILNKIDCGHLNITQFLLEQNYEDQMTRLLMSKTKCMVRVYMLEGFDFAQRDIGSFSDPYLKISCGKK